MARSLRGQAETIASVEDPFGRRSLRVAYHLRRYATIYVIGTVLDDGTVRGGTGWGAEFAKLCNKPLHAYDQEKGSWFIWTGDGWDARTDTPRVTHVHFTGTGTRKILANGTRAIEDLFTRSFGAAS